MKESVNQLNQTKQVTNHLSLTNKDAIDAFLI